MSSFLLAIVPFFLSVLSSAEAGRLRVPSSAASAKADADPCDCANECKRAASFVQNKQVPRAFTAVSKTKLQKASVVCPPGKPCGCGCHCPNGASVAAPPPPIPTYPPPWWTAPCPPWGCACNYGVCVPGVTHPGPPILDALPIGKPGLPGGLSNSNVPALPDQPVKKLKPCPTDKAAPRPWWCPEPPDPPPPPPPPPPKPQKELKYSAQHPDGMWHYPAEPTADDAAKAAKAPDY